MARRLLCAVAALGSAHALVPTPFPSAVPVEAVARARPRDGANEGGPLLRRPGGRGARIVSNLAAALLPGRVEDAGVASIEPDELPEPELSPPERRERCKNELLSRICD